MGCRLALAQSASMLWKDVQQQQRAINQFSVIADHNCEGVRPLIGCICSSFMPAPAAVGIISRKVWLIGRRLCYACQ